MQKRHILDEIEHFKHVDICLNIIEHLDSYWLGREANRIKQKRDE